MTDSPDASWFPCKVSRRDFEWRICPSVYFAPLVQSSRILQIRSCDHTFDIILAVTDHSGGEYGGWSFLGPLVALGPEYPLADTPKRPLRVRLPKPTSAKHGVIHSALVQAIIQRCYNARHRKCIVVNKHGLTPQQEELANKVFEMTRRKACAFNPKASRGIVGRWLNAFATFMIGKRS